MKESSDSTGKGKHHDADAWEVVQKLSRPHLPTPYPLAAAGPFHKALPTQITTVQFSSQKPTGNPLATGPRLGQTYD
jgi:hypothetical protein